MTEVWLVWAQLLLCGLAIAVGGTLLTRYADVIANPQAVRLSMAPDVPAEVRARIARVAEDIVAGRVHVPETYDGPEFATPA